MDLRITSFEDYKTQYQKSVDDPEAFWSEIAQQFTWQKPWTTALQWNFQDPEVRWFDGGTMNITENMLDRYLDSHGDKVAFYWEPNSPEETERSITYR